MMKSVTQLNYQNLYSTKCKHANETANLQRICVPFYTWLRQPCWFVDGQSCVSSLGPAVQPSAFLSLIWNSLHPA